MGLNFGCKEQCAKLLQYQPKTYHWSIRQSKKSSQRLQENASLLQWHVWGKPPNRKGSGRELVFRPRTGRNEPVSPIGVVIVKFAHATCTGFWKEWKSGREGGDFWDGHYRPFCRLSTCCWERGSCFAVSRWLRPWAWPPRASHRASTAFPMSAAIPWAPAPTVSLMDGGRQNKNFARKRSLSGDTPGGRCCLSFPMRTLGLRPCIYMGRRSNSK